MEQEDFDRSVSRCEEFLRCQAEAIYRITREQAVLSLASASQWHEERRKSTERRQRQQPRAEELERRRTERRRASDD